MVRNKKSNVLISDDGITTTRKNIHVNLFVFLCRAVSAALAILGLLAFLKGNFGI
jgi:hypothetical protein